MSGEPTGLDVLAVALACLADAEEFGGYAPASTLSRRLDGLVATDLRSIVSVMSALVVGDLVPRSGEKLEQWISRRRFDVAMAPGGDR